MGVGPQAFIEERPTSQSVRLGGRYVNLSRLAEVSGYHVGHISRVFRGKREPTVECLESLAGYLQMPMQDLLECIKERKSDIHAHAVRFAS